MFLYVYRRTIILNVLLKCTFDIAIFYHVSAEFFIRHTYTNSRCTREAQFFSKFKVKLYLYNKKLNY